MMNKRRFGREPPKKTKPCRCGSTSKLIKRRNFPHGRKSGGRSYSVYRCNSCNTEIPLNTNQEVKR